MMSHIQFTWKTAALLLCVFTLHGCRQPGLHVVDDEPVRKFTSASQELSSQASQRQEETATGGNTLSGIVPKSSSGVSPGAKHSDALVAGSNAGLLSADVEQDDQLNVSKEGTATSQESELTEKYSNSAQISMQGVDSPAFDVFEQKKKAPALSHEAWFQAFVEATKLIEQDTSNEAAWERMNLLLDQGAEHTFLNLSITYPNDSNPTTPYEYTPLHYAAARGLLALVRKMIEHYEVPVGIQTCVNKNTPLHLAASRGQLDVVMFLVCQGADPNDTDGEGGSALHYAAAGRCGETSRDVVEYLAASGAVLRKSSRIENSLLALAVFSGNVPVVEYWVDTFSSDSDAEMDKITEARRALKISKRMREEGHREQEPIIRMLGELCESKNK
jgi:hypothetical protein